MDFERHATLLFCAKSVNVQGNGAEGDEEYMVFNHGIHRIHGMIISLVLLFGVAVSAVAAEPGITVEARQRYPWNGLVDLKFSITGESGTKYDTSFTAKDMVGGTNIAMKTIRKSDGTSATAVEQLLPGSYNWVWDAPADLQVDTATYNAFISDSSTVLITNRSLSATANFYAVFGGGSISQNIGFTEAHAYNVKTDGNGKSIQFQVLNGGYLKCVCVHLEQSGSDIVGHIKWARYMSPTFPLGTDFDAAEYKEYDISTSDSITGYGIKQLVLTYPNTSREPKFDRLTVTGMADISAFPYTVKFNANGGTGSMANQSFTYGTAKALTANAFTRTGYVFQGWATSASGGKVYNDKQSVKDLTTTSGAIVNLYAVWKESIRDKVQLWEGGPYWATTNIGAEKPEDYGYYFWWGDTVGYKRVNDKWVASDGSSLNFKFMESNVPTCNKNSNELQSQGWVTSDGVLASEHDAAQKHWGGDWRMPTKQELLDLNNNCDWNMTTINGVKGYIVHGRENYASASIFLPCTGCGYGSMLEDNGWSGEYWSSIPVSVDDASFLYFRPSFYNTMGGGGRYYGRSVRPLQGFPK